MVALRRIAVDEQIEVEMRHEELLTFSHMSRGYALSKDFFTTMPTDLTTTSVRRYPSKYRADVRDSATGPGGHHPG
jgi:hypothetical protein